MDEKFRRIRKARYTAAYRKRFGNITANPGNDSLEEINVKGYVSDEDHWASS